MGIRIIVGGPPDSGKSTFSQRLSIALSDQGVLAESVDLDKWSPTLDFIKGDMTKEEREKQKRTGITKIDMQNAAKRFRNVSKKYDIVIGDLPGGISKLSEIVVKTAKYGIIICKDDESKKIKEWEKFFKKNNVDLLGTIDTSLTGEEDIQQNNPIRARLVNLDRTPTITPVIISIATSLRSQLRI